MRFAVAPEPDEFLGHCIGVEPAAGFQDGPPDRKIASVNEQRIQQAFLNLIKNAIDAITSDEGTVSINAAKRRATDDIEDEKIGIYNYLKYRGNCTLDRGTVDIEIRDTGSGIPLDILPKVFDPFFTTKDVG